MTFMAYGEWYDILSIADEITSLYYDNMYKCDWQGIFHSLENHCENKRVGNLTLTLKSRCDIGTIMENLFEKHMIQTISSITAITDESVEMSMDTDPETMYEIMRTYGLNFGQMTANAVALWDKDTSFRD